MKLRSSISAPFQEFPVKQVSPLDRHFEIIESRDLVNAFQVTCRIALIEIADKVVSAESTVSALVFSVIEIDSVHPGLADNFY